MPSIPTFVLSSLVFTLAATHAYAGSRPENPLDIYQASVNEYAIKTGQPIPDVQDYVYGANMDVAHVVSRSPTPYSCAPVPMRMTYKDSAGRLKTMQYLATGKCRRDQE